MKSLTVSLLIGLVLVILAASGSAQVDDICREFGSIPSLEGPKLSAPFVYGRVVVRGLDSGSKLPKVTVSFSDREQPASRLSIDKSGNYCFKRTGGGTLIVEVDGVEAARRSLPALGPAQQREDFEIYQSQSQREAPPGVVSAKFSHPRNEKTADLYKKTAEAEKNKNPEKTVEYVKEIVSIDPADFIAWEKLGSLYFERNSLADAQSAYRKSLELRVDYTLAWINVGKLRVFQKQYESAIELFKQAISTDPDSARAYQLLGEAYLQTRQGTLGVAALNQAIKLDNVGMAECHLLIARLYDLAGAKQQAANEYKIFLTKVTDHPDKKKFEKYIKDNP